MNASITIEKETEVCKRENRSNYERIHIDYNGTLKLKCSVSSKLPHVKGRWHSCEWTEQSGSNFHRKCLTQYSENSTQAGIGQHVTCEDSESDTIIEKELEVYSTGEHTCILAISPGNHTYRDEYTNWTCSFTECDTSDCNKANSCTATALIEVFVSN